MSQKELEPIHIPVPEEIPEVEPDDGLDWGGEYEEFYDTHLPYYKLLEEKRQQEEKEERDRIREEMQAEQ